MITTRTGEGNNRYETCSMSTNTRVNATRNARIFIQYGSENVKIIIQRINNSKIQPASIIDMKVKIDTKYRVHDIFEIS